MHNRETLLREIRLIRNIDVILHNHFSELFDKHEIKVHNALIPLHSSGIFLLYFSFVDFCTYPLIGAFFCLFFT